MATIAGRPKLQPFFVKMRICRRIHRFQKVLVALIPRQELEEIASSLFHQLQLWDLPARSSMAQTLGLLPGNDPTKTPQSNT